MICNKGYTIERFIHGQNEEYNDIQPWDYARIPEVFGAKENYKGYRIRTRDQLRKLFSDEGFCVPDYPRVSDL